MKLWLIILLLCYGSCLPAQQRFLKTITDAGYGRSLRILATPDNGWVVFSLDSVKLTKFNNCGTIEWSKKYKIPFCQFHADFITTTTGGFALLSRQSNNGVGYNSLITLFDGLGTLLSSKTLRLNLCDQVPYTLLQDAQGNYLVYGNTTEGVNTTYNMLCKVDMTGTVLWTHFYDLGVIWGGALVTSDQGFLLRTGNRFIKTDALGNVQWTTRADVLSATYYRAVEVSDGYIFTAIGTGAQVITFYKLSKQGNLLWGGGKESNYKGDLPHLRKLPGDRFAAVFNAGVAGAGYPVVIEFDKDATPLSHTAYASNPPGTLLFGKDLAFLNDGSPVVTGFATGSLYPFCIKTDLAYQNGCSQPAPAMTYTVVPATHLPIQVGKAPRTFVLNTEAATMQTLALAATNLCQVPKQLDLGPDTAFCQGDTLRLKNLHPDLFNQYLWSTGDTTPSVLVSQSGHYWLKVKDKCETAFVTDSVQVTIRPATLAALGNDRALCEDSMLVLQVPVCSNCIYTWSTGANGSALRIHEPGIYWLRIDNANGCSSSDTIAVNPAKCQCTLFVPNAFTPDNDGLNDVFKPKYHCDMQGYLLRIFNRWGDLIYETTDPEAAWDGYYKGQLVLQDVYNYQLSYRPIVGGHGQAIVYRTGKVAVLKH